MGETTYIETDAQTAHLVELLLLEIKDLKASVDRLSPLEPVQLLSENEAAAILHISKRTLVILRTEKKIPYLKIESRVLYTVEDIREFEGRCRIAGTK